MNSHYYPALDETLFRQRLPGGLEVAVIPRRGFAKKICYLVADFGSIHRRFTLDGVEYTVPAGTAHYLEHKMFDMPNNRDITAQFAAMGANVNAFTSFDLTAYYFACTEHFADCLKLLLEFVFTPHFTQESLERERPIIRQEIDMNLDSPDSVIFDDLMAAMYRHHDVRTPILGTRESIREITPEILSLCHRGFYTPGNMLLCVIGDVDPDRIAEIAREITGDTPRPVAAKQPFPPEPEEPFRREVRRRMDVAMPTFSLAFKCPPTGTGEAAIRREMVADLAAEALFGESSELYLELYERGLIDSSFGGGFESMDGCAMLCAGGDSEDALAVRDAILAQGQKIAALGIGREHFLRMKRSALGRRIRGLDSMDGTCFRVCAYHFSQFDYFRFPEIYQGIQEDDILEFLRHTIRPEKCAISIIDPLCE